MLRFPTARNRAAAIDQRPGGTRRTYAGGAPGRHVGRDGLHVVGTHESGESLDLVALVGLDGDRLARRHRMRQHQPGNNLRLDDLGEGLADSLPASGRLIRRAVESQPAGRWSFVDGLP